MTAPARTTRRRRLPAGQAAMQTSFISADLDVLSTVFVRDVVTARILGVNSAQLSRWRQGQLPDDLNQTRVRVLANAVRDLTTVLLPDVIAAWMESPRVGTELSPADLLRSSDFEAVRAMVEEQVQGDVFS